MLARLTRWTGRLRPQHGLALVGLGLVAYFGYHALIGSRGLIAWREVTAELADSQQQLDGLRAERTTLERKVRRLRHDSLDADLIDELARRELSFVDPMDVIILLDAKGGSK